MIRTFWFAAFCLAGLGGLLATRVTASMAFTGEGVLDPVMLGEGLAQDALAKDTFTKDTLTKADRLDVAYVRAMAMIAKTPAEPVAVYETKPRATARAAAPHAAASHLDRTTVMLPKPRPRIGIAKNSHPAKPVLEVKTCSPPEGLSGLLMAFSGQPRCG